jgi:anti-anti-sigma factor
MHLDQELDFALSLVDGRPTIRGECDFTNAAEIESWLDTFGRAAIDVDLSGVTYFGAAALRALLAAARRNPNMRIVAPSPTVARVLDLTGLRDFLVYGTTLS